MLKKIRATLHKDIVLQWDVDPENNNILNSEDLVELLKKYSTNLHYDCEVLD